MTKNKDKTIVDFVNERNAAKYLFTPGPASLLAENITGLRPCFGRGDADYKVVDQKIIGLLQSMSGHEHIIPIQGSASLALEIMVYNFLVGKVLIISTGYYSDRLEALAAMARQVSGHIDSIDCVNWRDIGGIEGKYDWLLACSTETSQGLKLPIEWLSNQSNRLQAKLMLDATASIGLETGHDLADVIGFSSCKGLFGLTGAAFVACHELVTNHVNSFYLDLDSHLEKRMTGPYHAMCSLLDVLPVHSEFKEAVEINKRLFCKEQQENLVHNESHQPLICTYINRKISATSEKAVLYQSRANPEGQVVSHLGEVHLGRNAKGDILKNLTLDF